MSLNLKHNHSNYPTAENLNLLNGPFTNLLILEKKNKKILTGNYLTEFGPTLKRVRPSPARSTLAYISKVYGS
jgi:hypothetical protein